VSGDKGRKVLNWCVSGGSRGKVDGSVGERGKGRGSKGIKGGEGLEK
jgi:hypothetical protein